MGDRAGPMDYGGGEAEPLAVNRAQVEPGCEYRRVHTLMLSMLSVIDVGPQTRQQNHSDNLPTATLSTASLRPSLTVRRKSQSVSGIH